jgi:thioredoxin reductase (NADPH)
VTCDRPPPDRKLFREGDRGYDFIVILSGTVTIYTDQPGGRRELATGGAGEFVAELGVLTGERLFTTAVVREPGAILVVPVARLRTVIAQDQVLSDLILQTAFRRRAWLTQAHVGMRIVGSRHNRDTRRLTDFVTRNHLLHVWVDADDPNAAGAISASTDPRRRPQVVLRTGEVLDNPSNAELSRAAGFGTDPDPGHTYDLVVVGSGPAGLAASVYAGSDGLHTATIDGLGVGGQIGHHTDRELPRLPGGNQR